LDTKLCFRPAGDRALAVECGNEISEEVNNRVRSLAWAIQQAEIAGVQEIIPTYRSILILYRPEQITAAELTTAVDECAAAVAVSGLPDPQVTVIPVAYGGEYGPDLAYVAEKNGLTPAEVIELHSSRDYLIYMLGFTPGFPYLGGMTEKIAAPRLENPRLRIPAGSVGIAGRQTGVYPVDSPGGWRLIGRTPLRLYEPGAVPPVLLRAGNSVRFRPIDAVEYDRLAAESRLSETTEIPAPVGCPLCDVRSGGLLTTVQDLGRYGYQQYGVPTAGAMDEFSLRIANWLVGNPENAAALEITLSGPVLAFRGPTIVSVSGGDLSPQLNGAPVPMWESFAVQPGDVLSFAGRQNGCRAYLAVAGGFQVPEVMGSRSTYVCGSIGGLAGRALIAGDILTGQPPELCSSAVAGRRLPAAFRPDYGEEVILRVILGPQDDLFTPEGLELFSRSTYTITADSDRMGYRLAGPAVNHKAGADIISDGLPLGAVQVPGHGNPIIMLADRQTTGGYAKIATVSTADLPRLAQMLPGQRIRFQPISPATARQVYLEYLAELGRCAAAINTGRFTDWRLTIDGTVFTVSITETE